MPAERTNPDWVQTLSGTGSPQAEAIAELRNLLLRAALFTLASHLQDLRKLEDSERMALAEDCVQEAIQAVLAHLPEFRGESKFTTWAYKFGINITLSRIRREHWKNISLEMLSEGDDDPFEWIRWKDGLVSNDSDLPSMQAEVSEVIREAIRFDLTEKQRQVLKWIAFDEVPMDVVVERLESNRNAIYKLLHDSRIKIKRNLAAHGYEVEEVYNLFRVV